MNAEQEQYIETVTMPDKLERWGEGAWSEEPDRIETIYRNIPCLLRRTNMGAWCGYIGLPQGHPWVDIEVMAFDADVHGDITFSQRVASLDAKFDQKEWSHFADKDVVAWVGFDCCHSFDLVPEFAKHPLMGGTYREVSYATKKLSH